ncbi:MAG: class I adenylate-forming enzyme family protein [Acidimicrobiia bacterium]
MEIPALDYTPTLPVFLRKRAAELGEKDFVVTLDKRMSYAEAERTSRRVAKELIARGAGKGARIGFMFGNGTEWVVSWLAISRIGGIAMPFSTAYRPAELLKGLKLGDVDTLMIPKTLVGHDHLSFVEHTLPSLAHVTVPGRPLRLPEAPYLRSILITESTDRAWAGTIDLEPGHGSDHPDISDELFEAIEADVHPSDPIFVIFTSGTTAEPKGVVHTHGTWVRHGANVAEANDVRSGHITYGGMPLFWIGGVSHTLGPLMQRGNTFLCTEKFDPSEAIELVIREKATQLYMFPNMIQRFRDEVAATGVDVTGVPAFAPVTPPEPGSKAQSLGMTETCAAYMANGPLEDVIPDEYRGAFGLPVPMMQYKFIDLETGDDLPEGVEGEICVRGYNLMAGMLKKERHETFLDDGFYRTGDKGYRKGPYFFFNGRAKDLIKSSGANVAPREVEVLLDSYPEVLMSVVMGVMDPERGETVGAAIVRRSGAAVDPVELVTRLNRELSSYKVPRKVLVIDEAEMPYVSTGKPDRQALASRVEADGVSVSPRRESDS